MVANNNLTRQIPAIRLQIPRTNSHYLTPNNRSRITTRQDYPTPTVIHQLRQQYLSTYRYIRY